MGKTNFSHEKHYETTLLIEKNMMEPKKTNEKE
jgi:hypothetical protein